MTAAQPLLAELLALPQEQWRSLAATNPSALSTAFQLWLSDQQRTEQSAAVRETISKMLAELVSLKDWQV